MDILLYLNLSAFLSPLKSPFILLIYYLYLVSTSADKLAVTGKELPSWIRNDQSKDTVFVMVYNVVFI